MEFFLEKSSSDNLVEKNTGFDSDSRAISDIMDVQKETILMMRSFVDSVNSKMALLEEKVVKLSLDKNIQNANLNKKPDISSKELCEKTIAELNNVGIALKNVEIDENIFFSPIQRINELEQRFEMLKEVIGIIPGSTTGQKPILDAISFEAEGLNLLSGKINKIETDLSFVKQKISQLEKRISDILNLLLLVSEK